MSTRKIAFHVEVEIDDVADGDGTAALIAEQVLGWPGSWSPPHAPVPVRGKFGRHDKTFEVRIIRSQALMVKELP